MTRIERWKRIFTQPKEKVPVKVGDKLADMTRTQAYRFDELSKSTGDEEQPAAVKPGERRQRH